MSDVNTISLFLVMGVSGSGKSTIAKKLAEHLSITFMEADDYHPAGNIEKMRAGIPLTDEDRQPWIDALRDALVKSVATGHCVALACSALHKRYREELRGSVPANVLIYLKGSESLIIQRVAARQGHFMPVTLLDSQFTALEEPGPDEQPLVVSIEGTPEETLEKLLKNLQARS
jgi:carbohydrate kinase (thermoresistant glucokinase family)